VIELYLVRHAIAEDRDPARWPDDSQRPLTRQGIDRFRRAAHGLRRIVPTVEHVSSSPYVRAWQTAELLRDDAGWPEPEAALELGADSEPREALELLRRHTSRASLALVGHEPYLTELASLLMSADDGLSLELKKGGVIALASDVPGEPGASVMRWAVAPKILRALAEV